MASAAKKEQQHNEGALNALKNSDIVSDPFYTNAYLKAFSGNIVRKLLCSFIILINIFLIALVFVQLTQIINSNQLLWTNIKLPSFFKTFAALSDVGKISVWGWISLYGTISMVLVDIILFIIVLTFGSMRKHIKKLESTKL